MSVRARVCVPRQTGLCDAVIPLPPIVMLDWMAPSHSKTLVAFRALAGDRTEVEVLLVHLHLQPLNVECAFFKVIWGFLIYSHVVDELIKKDVY